MHVSLDRSFDPILKFCRQHVDLGVGSTIHPHISKHCVHPVIVGLSFCLSDLWWGDPKSVLKTCAITKTEFAKRKGPTSVTFKVKRSFGLEGGLLEKGLNVDSENTTERGS